YPELAFAQRWAVEVRQIINRRARRVHGGLVDQMNFAQKRGITGRRVGQSSQPLKKGHAGWAVLLEHGSQTVWQILDRSEGRLRFYRRPAGRCFIVSHCNILSRGRLRRLAAAELNPRHWSRTLFLACKFKVKSPKLKTPGRINGPFIIGFVAFAVS